MDINLNFLKFHYFYCDKNIHNLCIKKYKEYFDKLLFKVDHSLILILDKIDKYNEDNIENLKNSLIRFHSIDNNHRDILLNKIIKKHHPNLYGKIQQFFENYNLKDVKFYQCKMDKKERLIFTIHINDKNRMTFIPLIFDLNHVIYKDEDKNYDNKNLIHCCKWDLREEQEKLKMKLKEGIK